MDGVGLGGGFVLLVVLFILLIIIGTVVPSKWLRSQFLLNLY